MSANHSATAVHLRRSTSAELRLRAAASPRHLSVAHEALFALSDFHVPSACVRQFCDFLFPTTTVVCASRDALAALHGGDATAFDVEFPVDCPGDICDVAAAGPRVVLARGLGFTIAAAPDLHRVCDADGTHAAQVLAVSISHAGSVATSCADGSVAVWSMPESGVTTVTPPLLLHGHADWVRFVEFSTDALGKLLLVSGGDDGRVCVWDAHTGDLLYNVTLPRRCVRCLTVAQHGPLEVAAAGDDPVVHLLRWNCGELQPRLAFSAHDSIVTSMSMCDNFICTAAEDELIKLHLVHSGQLLAVCKAHQISRICVGFMSTITRVCITAHPPESSAIVVMSCSSEGDFIKWAVTPGAAPGHAPRRSYEQKTNLNLGELLAMTVAPVLIRQNLAEYSDEEEPVSPTTNNLGQQLDRFNGVSSSLLRMNLDLRSVGL